MSYFSNAITLAAALVTSLMVAGPAWSAEHEEPEAARAAAEEHVRERVEARWKALIKGDFEAAYGFLSPTYRSTTPFKQWRGKFGEKALWSRVDIASLTCNTSTCDVAVRVYVQLMFHVAGRHTPHETSDIVRERWVHDDGQDTWWHVPFN